MEKNQAFTLTQAKVSLAQNAKAFINA